MSTRRPRRLPIPPGGIGDDPPDALNLVMATIRLLVDLEGADRITDAHRERIGALLAACRRYRKSVWGA